MSYMSVYVSRMIESISHGPCWSIKDDEEEPAPSEQQMEAETFSTSAINFLSARSKKLMNSPTWDSDVDSTEALAELALIANKIADQLTSSLQVVLALFTILEVLEVLVDCLTFADLYEAENWFDGGVIAGKGLVNAGFTLQYLIMEYTREPGTFKRFDYEDDSGLF